MYPSITIALLDPDERRRAAISHRMNDTNLQVLPFDGPDELKFSQIKNAVALVHDQSNSIEILSGELERLNYWLPIIAYSLNPKPQKVAAALIGGAMDYLPQDFTRSELTESLTQVEARAGLIRKDREESDNARAMIALLSSREQNVLFGILEGLSNKEISDRLGISHRTVEIHRKRAFVKLGVKNSSAAARFVIEAKRTPTRAPWHWQDNITKLA